MRGSPLDLRRVLVVGAGTSGQGAVSALGEIAGAICVVDDGVKGSSWTPQSYSKVVFFGTQRSFLQTFSSSWPTLVVLSPGFTPLPELILNHTEVIGEVELGYRLSKGTLIGVTGTNGKTSVTQMISNMLDLAEIPAVAAGNIGVPFSKVATQDGIKVVELSSFQLERTTELHLDVAIWTNFAPDHLDVHGSLKNYKAAKERIWNNQGSKDLRVINADDAEVLSSKRSSGVREVYFSLEKEAEFCVVGGEILMTPQGPLARISELARHIPHETANLLCAAAAALEVGAPMDAVSEYVRSFAGFEHRVEFVASIEGVQFYNDSKATSPAATIAAVEAFSSVVLLAGGRNKGLDLYELLKVKDRLKKVVVFGEVAETLAQIFSSEHVACEMAWSMEEAVRKGYSSAHRGDVVLLSPANTSFDWYENYGQRGLDFKDKVFKVAGGR
jgi:UDP-N-acetylmuramoylalanine--D-glutamate ligase